MLNPETIQNLNDELAVIKDEIKVLNKRRKGIAAILGEQELPEKETTPETPQNAPESVEEIALTKVPLSFDFIYLNHEENKWLGVEDKTKFVPGIEFQALRANRVIPFKTKKTFKVVEVHPDHLLASAID